jgi:hypothetical protein
MRLPSISTIADVRRRLSRGSLERHTSHWQPIVGTPCDVPVPRNVKRIVINGLVNQIDANFVQRNQSEQVGYAHHNDGNHKILQEFCPPMNAVV